MLLRPDVHVWPQLLMPSIVWMHERKDGVAVSAARASEPTVHPAPPSPGRAGSRELLGLLAAERPAFLAFVRRRVRSGADAEDLLQQALLKATEKLDALRDGERLDAWFYRVLRNTIADHHVAWARRESRLEQLAREASIASPVEAAVCGCSLGILETLQSEYGELLRRVDIDEEPIGDVAHALKITPNNAKVRLHRARKALRGALTSYCATDSVQACLSCTCD